MLGLRAWDYPIARLMTQFRDLYFSAGTRALDPMPLPMAVETIDADVASVPRTRVRSARRRIARIYHRILLLYAFIS